LEKCLEKDEKFKAMLAEHFKESNAEPLEFKGPPFKKTYYGNHPSSRGQDFHDLNKRMEY